MKHLHVRNQFASGTRDCKEQLQLQQEKLGPVGYP